MHQRILMLLILAVFLAGNAQPIHIPSYFPVQDSSRWIYKDEFGNHDTATMRTTATFLQETNVELSFSQNEKQYFRADITGLRMLGQTIPLGTFMFDTPIGISGIDAYIGDGSSTYNWEVTHVPSGTHQSWGTAQALLERIETNFTVQDSTYDSVLVVSVLFGYGDAQYFLAKGRGIVKSIARGSPSFNSRELIKFIQPATSSNLKIWKTHVSNCEIRVITNCSGEMASFLFGISGNNIHAKVFNLKGQLISKSTFKSRAIAEIKLKGKWKPGRYILQVYDGAMYQNRSFSISR